VRTVFHDTSSEIAKGINRSAGMISKLTQLVKRQGLFDDPTEEINSLIFRIKEELGDLNSKCDVAQKYVDDKKVQLGDTNQLATHNTKVVSQLKTELMHRTKDFKTALELRSSKMKDQQQRKIELTGNGVLSPMKQFAASTGSDMQGAKSLKQSAAQPISLPTPYNMVSAPSIGGGTPGPPMHLQQQELLLAPVASHEYYQGRQQAVNEVEKTIGELGSLFNRLATMIHEQQELVERIDDDVENAIDNSNRAQALLQKAYESASSNKGMYMKLAAIAGGFVVFFVLFVL
jgi:syntaxin 5